MLDKLHNTIMVSSTTCQTAPSTGLRKGIDACKRHSKPVNMSTQSVCMCPICQIEFKSSCINSSKLSCGHMFHKSCLSKWENFKKSKGEVATCPMCRAPFTQRSVSVNTPSVPDVTQRSVSVNIPSVPDVTPDEDRMMIWLRNLTGFENPMVALGIWSPANHPNADRPQVEIDQLQECLERILQMGIAGTDEIRNEYNRMILNVVNILFIYFMKLIILIIFKVLRL